MTSRVYDFWRSCAAAVLECGDDRNTLQTNLGRAAAAFAMDVYGQPARN